MNAIAAGTKTRIQWRAVGASGPDFNIHSHTLQADTREHLENLMCRASDDDPTLCFSHIERCQLTPDEAFYRLPNWTVLETFEVVE